MINSKYIVVKNWLKELIQSEKLKVGSFIPSENELCERFSVTRTTVRKALEELLKEGYIQKIRGKGSMVRERRQSLGLLTVKGFSEAVGQNVKTVFLQRPNYADWPTDIKFKVTDDDRKNRCIFFSRLRKVNDLPVMVENNWFSEIAIPGFIGLNFVDGSFFKTLSRNFLIEIVGSEHELRAEKSNPEIAGLLKIKTNNPVLHISVRFITNNPQLTIYSELFCNTTDYPVGNGYFIK